MSALGEKKIEFAKLRIIDFYLVFPHLVKDVTLPKSDESNQLRKLCKQLPTPYERLPDTKVLFSEMGDFQIQALHILKAKDILAESTDELICKGDAFSRQIIGDLVHNNSYLTNEYFLGLIRIFSQTPLTGDSGLKKRTGLMEYRYDAV